MNNLKKIRKEAGFTQIQAAKLCGVSRRTYQTYEEKGNFNDVHDELVERLKEVGFDGEFPSILNIRLIKRLTSEIFAKYPEVECAYLFGSYSRDEATVKSDVDILVIAPKLEGLNFAGLHYELRTALHKDVDLVPHTTLLNSEKMLRDVLKQGVKIYGQRTDQFKN